MISRESECGVQRVSCDGDATEQSEDFAIESAGIGFQFSGEVILACNLYLQISIAG